MAADLGKPTDSFVMPLQEVLDAALQLAIEQQKGLHIQVSLHWCCECEDLLYSPLRLEQLHTAAGFNSMVLLLSCQEPLRLQAGSNRSSGLAPCSLAVAFVGFASHAESVYQCLHRRDWSAVGELRYSEAECERT